MSRLLRPGMSGLATSGPWRPIPVTLFGGDTDGLDAALVRWLAQRPAGERWAVVRDPGWQARTAAPAAHRDMALPAAGPKTAAAQPYRDSDTEIIDFSAGCACCVAASAFSLALTRILRRGPWSRLLVVLPASADPGAVADALRTGPVASALADIAIVCAIGRVPSERPLTDPLRRAIGAADLVLLARSDKAACEALLATSASDPGCDPLGLVVQADDLDWAALQAGLQTVRAQHRWRWLGPINEPTPAQDRVPTLGKVCAPPPVQMPLPGQGLYLASGSSDLPMAGWVWPATHVFDRRRIEAALRVFASDTGRAQVRAVIRTARDWYAFAAGSAQTASAPDSANPWWAPTASRRESRIEWRASHGISLAAQTWSARWLACQAEPVLDTPAR